MSARRPFTATYIMANRRNAATYVGMTSNLRARVWKHRNGTYDGYSKDKGCTLLVWYERHERVVEAIRREKRIKGWKRDWKLKLIEDGNPGWADLAADWFPVNDPNWEPPLEED
ncbi:GIY-YIG nuclease family protein [Brevundimonas sp.]